MTDVAIKVENLSKRYRIGLEEELPDTLVGALTQAVTRPLRNWRQLQRLTDFDGQRQLTNDQFPPSAVCRSSGVRTDVNRDTLWALRDVSFEVKRGEVVGIIGRNGAGKSTLLKILACITHPTSGRAIIKGRVGSLLEVGTGFHSELTGRENIYMNGTLLGMTKPEVDRKFDEIVDFSGVETFIDTPVKRYSSGMCVRLAFSVAAHLEPEILLVDEVLAVGDIQFQRKCLGKMGDVAESGRTILFVSHNMAAVKNLCRRAVWLDEGKVKISDAASQVVDRYEEKMLSAQRNLSSVFPLTNPKYSLTLKSVSTHIVQEETYACLIIKVQLMSQELLSRIGFGIIVHTHDGNLVTQMGPNLTGLVVEEVEGECEYVIECPNINRFLTSGEYVISVAISVPSVRTERIIFAERIDSFHVPGFDHFGTGRYSKLKLHGLVPLPLRIKKET